MPLFSRASGVPTGAVMPYGGTAAPTGWALCDGSAVSRSTFATLFTAIGVAYGAGDGSTTFNLPDLRQRFPMGKAASGTGATLGVTGGAVDHAHTHAHTHAGATHTHTGAAHTHAVDVVGVASGAPSSIRSDLQTGMSNATAATDSHTHTTDPASVTSGGASAVDTGGASAVNTGGESAANTGVTNPPFQTVNYIIKT